MDPVTVDPRRALPRVPSYRLHRPSGRAVVTIAGTDHYLGEYASPKSLDRYRRLVAEFLAGGAAGAAVAQEEADGRTVAAVTDAYWAHLELKHGAADAARRFGRVRLALGTLTSVYGTTPVTEFGPRRLRVVQQELARSGLSRTVVNQRVQFIRRAFRWAVAEELVAADLAHRLAAVENLRRGDYAVREGRKVEPVAWEHVEPVLQHVSRPVAAMILLQWWTGMRPGEVVQMRACDIDRSGAVWIYRPRRHKTEHAGKSREIMLGPRAQDVLHSFLTRVPAIPADRPLFSPAEAEAERSRARRAARTSKLTPSQRARKLKANRDRAPRDAYDVASYRRAISRAIRLETANKAPLFGGDGARSDPLPHWHPHQLRHSAATRIRKEHGLEAARVVLGHSSPGITAVYAQVDIERAREVMASLG